MANEKLFVKNVDITIESIVFKTITRNTTKVESKVNVSDQLELLSATLEKAIIKVTRTINFEPESMFSLIIDTVLVLSLDDKTKEKLVNSNEVKIYIDSNMKKIVEKTVVFEKLSLLVAQVTAIDYTPLILPPVCMCKIS